VGWTIRDAREYGGMIFVRDATPLEVDRGVDVQVVYVEPRPGEEAPAWSDARNVFQALEAHAVPLVDADQVGQTAQRLLASWGY
jgi:hypothetical protein